MGVIRVFLASAYVGFRGTFAWMSPSFYVGQLIIIPLTQLTFFSLIGAYGGAQPLEFYLVGNAMALAATGGFFMAYLLTEERGLGTLPYLLASPANRLALFFGRVALRILETGVYVLLGFLWAALIFGLSLPATAWGGILLAAVTAAISISGLGLLVGALALVALDIFMVASLTSFGLLLVSGANIPLDELPLALRLLGQALPLSRSIEAARSLAAGEPLSITLPLLAGDLAVGITYGFCGYLLFRWMEIQARRRGTLESV